MSTASAVLLVELVGRVLRVDRAVRVEAVARVAAVDRVAGAGGVDGVEAVARVAAVDGVAEVGGVDGVEAVEGVAGVGITGSVGGFGLYPQAVRSGVGKRTGRPGTCRVREQARARSGVGSRSADKRLLHGQTLALLALGKRAGEAIGKATGGDSRGEELAKSNLQLSTFRRNVELAEDQECVLVRLIVA
jgi:hypothetical protein